MLFNSYGFILIFFPLVFLVFRASLNRNLQFALVWLTIASLAFYGWWDKRYLVLVVASFTANFFTGFFISRSKSDRLRLLLLVMGITANLTLLGYYKYWNFFVHELERTGLHWPTASVALPLGISFFTFTQIAFLTDTYRRLANEKSFVRYALFVTYFPHLIAGPLIHHKQVMSQFDSGLTLRVNSATFSSGLTLFVIGLAKKIFLADNFSLYATPVFDLAASASSMSAADAWCGTLAYTLQLYFDFSAYSDMAVGASRCFGIELPINFNSPYKSRSIIDFWRRWHITLSEFLRDYLYIPLGGNRHGEFRRYLNLGITMLLGGLWHGANWTFLVWGALHGAYLITNHLLAARFRHALHLLDGQLMAALQRLFVFLLVAIAWVFFRAQDLTSAWTVLSAMFGLGSGSTLVSNFSNTVGIAAGLVIAWGLPNSNEIVSKLSAPATSGTARALSSATPWLVGLSLWICLLMLDKKSEFLYFQF
ncbi:putative membrane protein involved in D-alanine export [Polaromonas sp. CF318]|uniref:MBOAT family O-acyltransferase n=1 Tax=Polaromonas sp. CF318 TaxID=1144318 RepID=UPI000270E270|nr:MBOAT family O-acyltransferase [Polaromonas sp. CF318]EJL91681.1 putative membrane protein involved in D-alanine export [Polaromonas sp. CF318]